jgi:thymidylate synthase
MKFEISRTSVYSDNIEDINVPNIYKQTVHIIDERTCTMAEARKLSWFNQWYNNTTNHRELNGHIFGDWKYAETINVIEIDNIMDFVKKYGKIVLSENSLFDYVEKVVDGHIEIYDNYRE